MSSGAKPRALVVDDEENIRFLVGSALQLAANARIEELNSRFRTELAKMKKVTLHTPVAAPLAAGIVCFEVAGVTPQQVVERLKARRIVASTSPYAVTYARVAAGVMVSPEDVETTLREIRAIAG